MSITAQQLLGTKRSGAVISAGPDDTIYDAVRRMIAENIGALLVLEGDALLGVLSERDCARRLVPTEKSAREIRVREIMTVNVIYARPEQTVEECMALMTAKRVRHLPVMKDGRLIGILSQGDIVKSIISDREFTIQQLENYITGSRGSLPP